MELIVLNLNEDTETPSKEALQQPGNGEKKPAVPPREQTAGRALLMLLVKVAFTAVVVWVLLTFVGGIFICHDNEMFPAVRDGDLLITFRLGEYHAGDVIAYEIDGRVRFGRIVGEPGDRIVIDEAGNFYINDLLQWETVYYETLPREDAQITYPYTIAADEFFVLCDMREQGYDSRVFGGVKKPLGKVVLQLRRRGF